MGFVASASSERDRNGKQRMWARGSPFRNTTELVGGRRCGCRRVFGWLQPAREHNTAGVVPQRPVFIANYGRVCL